MGKTRFALAAAALLAACSGDGSTGINAASLRFTATPIALSQIVIIFPLGVLEIGGHTTPSDHIYFYFADPDHCPCDITTRRPVLAVADGEVTDVQSGTDDKVTINAAVNVDYYYGHITARSGLGRGTHAGEQNSRAAPTAPRLHSRPLWTAAVADDRRFERPSAEVSGRHRGSGVRRQRESVRAMK